MGEPVVSIVITTYYSKDNLDKVLELVSKQTYKDFEVLVSDDGSYDYNHKWQEYPFPLKYIWQQNKGMRFCESINNAVKIAKGKWIWFLCADLFPPKNALEIYLKQADENIVLVGGRTSDGWDKEMTFDQVPDANLFFSKEMVIKAGLWDERMVGYGFEDYELMCRMETICGCKFMRVREAAAEHQDHPIKEVSKINEAIYAETLKIYKGV